MPEWGSKYVAGSPDLPLTVSFGAKYLKSLSLKFCLLETDDSVCCLEGSRETRKIEVRDTC